MPVMRDSLPATMILVQPSMIVDDGHGTIEAEGLDDGVAAAAGVGPVAGVATTADG